MESKKTIAFPHKSIYYGYLKSFESHRNQLNKKLTEEPVVLRKNKNNSIIQTHAVVVISTMFHIDTKE